MLTFLSRTSIFKTLNFIYDIESLTYDLNIVNGRHFEVYLLRIFRKSFNVSMLFLIIQFIVTC